MSLININRVYTADPGDIWTPKSAFMLSDPFAIVLNIQADGSLVREGLLFDAVFQILGPQQDAHGYPWWTIVNGDVVTSPSRDALWNGISFQWGTSFAIWWSWSQYLDAVIHIGNAKLGVFYAQGTVSVQGSNLFANSGQFWFKVR
jgi:hypothetical protein